MSNRNSSADAQSFKKTIIITIVTAVISGVIAFCFDFFKKPEPLQQNNNSTVNNITGTQNNYFNPPEKKVAKIILHSSLFPRASSVLYNKGLNQTDTLWLNLKNIGNDGAQNISIATTYINYKNSPKGDDFILCGTFRNNYNPLQKKEPGQAFSSGIGFWDYYFVPGYKTYVYVRIDYCNGDGVKQKPFREIYTLKKNEVNMQLESTTSGEYLAINKYMDLKKM
jgi:hypothetical protein